MPLEETELPLPFGLEVSHYFRHNQVLHFWGAVVILQNYTVSETLLRNVFLEIAEIWLGCAAHLTIINFMMNLTDK